MKNSFLIFLIIIISILLTACKETEVQTNSDSLYITDVSGEANSDDSSGDMDINEEIVEDEYFDVVLSILEVYEYAEDDTFAKENGEGIVKYELAGLKSEKVQRIINDKLADLYDDAIKEYEDNVSTEYLPSLRSILILDNENVLSFGISKKWITNVETCVNEYYTINKNTGEVMELSDFYENKHGYLRDISNLIYDKFEERKIQLKKEYGIDDNNFFKLDADDFYNKISLDQNSFYISENGELTYYFQKYEIGPGVIGEQEFVLIENVEF